MKKPFRLSVKMVIKDDKGRCLLLKRSMSSKRYPGKWDLPGGKVDSGENFDEALFREISEETGLKVSIQNVAGTVESETTTVRFVHLILVGHMELGAVRLSSEHDEYRWVSLQEFPMMDLSEPFKSFAKTFREKEKAENHASRGDTD